MSVTTHYQHYWINPRIKIAALWTSLLFVYAYVDLFSWYRADVRADIEAGEIFVFTIGQGFLLGVTVYVVIPSLLVFLSLVMWARLARMVNVVVAVLYAVTIAGGAIGESNYYYLLGSVVEVALLAGVVFYAWTWPKATDPARARADRYRAGTRVRPGPR